MKNKTAIYTIVGLCLVCGAIIVSCSLTGCTNLVPPTKTEQALYTTITNVVTVTNQVPVPVEVRHTNEVILYSTNELHQTVTTLSNWVNTVWQTNIVPIQVLETNHVFTTKPEVKDAVTGIGALVNGFVPGAGAAATEITLGLLGVWAHLRSRRKGTTATALVQELETVRQFLKTLPNGASYDEAVVSFLKDHQNEVGVATQVIGILSSQLKNPDAKMAAQSIIDYVNSLKTTTAPLPPVNPAA